MSNNQAMNVNNKTDSGYHHTSSIIEITDKALEQIVQILQAEKPVAGTGLRVGVMGGGCSGLSYKIEFGAEKEKDNILYFGDNKDIKVLIDPKSAIYLKGVLLDFQDGLNGKGFIFQNPNAKNTCGCGESFSV